MMVAAQVVGNDATIAWANALGSNFDLNVMMPVIAYNLLQSIELLTNAAQHLADKCIDARKHLEGKDVKGVTAIEADAARCQLLIERSLAMCTALAPRIGYDNAAAIAKLAYQEGLDVRAVALEPGRQDSRGGRGATPRPRRGGRIEGEGRVPDQRGDRAPARPARADHPGDRRRRLGRWLSDRAGPQPILAREVTLMS